jgi:hypothetical protein
MFSLAHPEILSHLGTLQYGLQPVTMPSGQVIVIVKMTKEAILAAKLNQGFKIYVVPDEAEGAALGLISAFFDDDDEPLTLRTPLYGDDQMLTDLAALLKQERFELYFFDEHDRELIGVVVDNAAASRWAEVFGQTSFRAFDMTDVPAVLTAMEMWFSHRNGDDDQAALPVAFCEKLYPDDFVIIDARTDGFDFVAAGGKPVTSLVREDPGPFQERDIVSLMSRLFPTDAILLNPFRVDAPTEFADVVVATGDILLIIQAKDSPNTEQSLRRTLDRKRLAITSHLDKAVNQLRGALTHLATNPELKLRLPAGDVTVATGEVFTIGLIVLREMFDDQFKDYSTPVLKLVQSTGLPCLVLDYAALHILSCSLGTWESFIGALDEMVRFGLEHGEFPRPRFLGPPSGIAGAE